MPPSLSIFKKHNNCYPMTNYLKLIQATNHIQNVNEAMSDREPTRWQHNRIYPRPINPCVYTYDSICH